MAILIIDQSNDYEYFCHKYKVPTDTKNRFRNISKNFENLKAKKYFKEENIKKMIYFLGKKNVKDLLLFSIFINKKVKTLDIEKMIDYVDNYKIPKLPISGDDLKKYGYKSGPELGKRLKLLEEKWIESDFVFDKKFLKKFSDKIKQN